MTDQAKPEGLRMEGITFEGRLYCLEIDARKIINRLLAENSELRKLIPPGRSQEATMTPHPVINRGE